jgi:hypothetical protein
VQVASVVVTWLGIALAAGCGGAPGGEAVEPVVTVAPDEFVLREVRRAAAQRLGCQVPNIGVAMGPWAGSEGNVIAAGCGYEVTFYLRCLTNHQCSIRFTD